MSDNIKIEANKDEPVNNIDKELPEQDTESAEDNVDPFQDFESRRIKERRNEDIDEPEEIKENPVKKVGRPPKEDKGEVPEVKDLDNKDNSSTLKEIEELKTKYEKEKKAAYEAQRWGTKNSQRVKGAEKRLKALIEENILTSEEEEKIKEVLGLLASDPKEDIEIESNTPSHPMQKFFKIANEQLPNFRQYTDDENLDNKIGSFNAFCREATPEELQKAIDELEDCDNDILKLKKMLVIGQRNYEEGFKEIIQSGGVKKALQEKNKEIKKLTDKVDQLKKKLTEYEDFDNNTNYRIGESSIASRKDEDLDEDTDPFLAFEARKKKEALRQKRR